MLNKLCCIGRLTKDPELRRTQQGTAVASFNLACNRTFKSADGQEADFIPCVIWNKGAENVERYCSKGSLVGVEGRIQTRSYENSQGQKKYIVEVICDVVQFMETRAVNEEQSKKDIYQTDYNENSLLRDLEKEFDNSLNTFEISEDDLPF